MWSLLLSVFEANLSRRSQQEIEQERAPKVGHCMQRRILTLSNVVGPDDCTWWTSQPITHIWSKNVLWPSEGVSLLYKSHTKSFSSWALLMLQLLTTLARVNQSTKTNFQLFLEHPSLSPHTWLLSHTSPINPLHPSGGASHCLRAPATTEPITKIWLRLGIESVLPLTSSRKMLLTLRGDSVFLSDSLDLDCVFCPKRNF